MYCFAGHLTALECGMHAQLVRAGCTLPALQASLLPQLVSFLGAYSWGDAAQAAWLTSLIPDLVDAVQSTEGSTGVLLEGGQRGGLGQGQAGGKGGGVVLPCSVWCRATVGACIPVKGYCGRLLGSEGWQYVAVCHEPGV